jgi:hypothetical protein
VVCLYGRPLLQVIARLILGDWFELKESPSVLTLLAQHDAALGMVHRVCCYSRLLEGLRVDRYDMVKPVIVRLHTFPSVVCLLPPALHWSLAVAGKLSSPVFGQESFGFEPMVERLEVFG